MVQITADDAESAASADPPATSGQTVASGRLGPAKQIAVGVSPVDSEAITEDGISRVHQSGSDEAVVDSLPSGFTGQPASLSDENSPSDSITPPPVAGLPMDWQSDRTRKTRQVVLIGTLASSLMLITAVVFWMFVQSQRASSLVEGNQNATSADASDAVDRDSSDTVDDAKTIDVLEDAPDGDDEEKGDPEAAQNVQGNAGMNDVGSNAPDSTINKNQQLDDPDPAASGTSIQSESASPTSDDMPDRGDVTEESSQVSTSPTVVPESLLPKSPLDEPTDDPNASQLMELPAGLRKFTPFLLQEGPAQETTLEAPATMEDIEVDAAAEEDAELLDVDEPEPINIKSDLGLRVAFQSKGYPLTSFTLLLSQMTGVPIHIDWDAFDLCQIDVAKPIVPTSGAKTARQWLDIVADQVNGKVVTREFMIELTVDDDFFANRLSSISSTDGFENDSDSAREVIKQFMPPNAANPGIARAGNAAEALGDRERAKLLILATEALRRMRGLPGSLPEDSSGRWIQPSDSFRDWPLLTGGRPIGALKTPVSTAGLIRKIAKENGSSCLINWMDASRRGLRATRLIMPLPQESASSWMTSILSRFSLQVRQVDNRHWWIGSEATYDRLPVLVMTPKLGASRDTFDTQVQRMIQKAGPGVYRSTHDPVSDRTMLLLPRFFARQLSKVDQSLASKL